MSQVDSTRADPSDPVIIIPARYGSTRFPGKPLTQIRGADGVARPLVQWSHLAAKRAGTGAHICVATDDDKIIDVVRSFGGQAVETPESCRNGTERVAACLDLFPDADVFVNVQGDALLTPPDFVKSLITYMMDNPDVQVCTAGIRCTEATYRHLADDAEAGRVGGTTLVMNAAGEALYFSKRLLPYLPSGTLPDDERPIYLHLGLYAYRRAALEHYVSLDVTMLETVEGLEQLRFLVHGIPVKVLVFPEPDFAMVEVNNMSDVAIVEKIFHDRAMTAE
ncbi:3-deoxy-manno-octulosonate cytidylyltransferase (CMP-KDO synthetase) [Sphingobium sp. B2D3A]|uniref:3-deoxy-manno-octulosonate cytidylyltransferase n=1 Tax=unclassified Sphingobium TaxID=2611147 RepID=UPI0022253D7A|nr:MULTISPECIES: 3-deoxy-manno-octulosonate cytidylyltransferase [unclassified Sphingobium]MCW2338493.1 3-deoxy-manno-octulosonate cytidylyltransferase (CMP-KDO synthetase) [Sphingobium sp. B2D3A]MCW2384951.1 3-deoxy-manno-octulosonate cytidylyltransferase (CMP-KDO synthetase) [Sphingobium sp. B2D3D]